MPSRQSSMGILGLFRLNGAFLLLPSILSLLVVMTVILDHSIIIFLRVGGIFFFIFVLYSHGAWNTAKKVSLQWRYLVVFTTVLKRIHLSRVFWLCVLSPFFNALTDQPLSDWSLPVVYSILTSFQYAEFLKQKNSESDGINVFEKQDRSKRKCAIT